MVYFVNFLLPPGFLCPEWLLDCCLCRHRSRSGDVPSFWFREGVPAVSGYITGTVYSAPYFLGAGPGWTACFRGPFVFEDEIQSMLH